LAAVSVVLALAGCRGGSLQAERTAAAVQPSAVTSAKAEAYYLSAANPAGVCSGGVPGVKDRPDLVGKSVAEVRRTERAAGHQVRIVGSGGSCSGTSDHVFDRVNLYTEQGIVVWAQVF
jgi:hypothetical protein